MVESSPCPLHQTIVNTPDQLKRTIIIFIDESLKMRRGNRQREGRGHSTCGYFSGGAVPGNAAWGGVAEVLGVVVVCWPGTEYCGLNWEKFVPYAPGS